MVRRAVGAPELLIAFGWFPVAPRPLAQIAAAEEASSRSSPESHDDGDSPRQPGALSVGS
jgi:hypothetical protein